MEIERKFVVSEAPDLSSLESTAIEQGYLSISTQGGAGVRLRRRGDQLTLTAKSGSGLARDEAEIDLGAEQFARLWPLTEGRRLVKRRYLIPAGELTIELDVYEGSLAGMVVAEVEFGDEGAAAAFEPPDWFGAEVTGQWEYLNEALATKGRP